MNKNKLTMPGSQMPPLDSNQMSVGLAAQLFLTHLIAAGVGILLWSILWQMELVGRLLIALSGVGLVGVLLNLNLVRSLRLLDEVMLHLVNLWPLPPFNIRKQGTLAGIFSQISVLAERERPLTEYRERQLHQASETAAQSERNRLARDLHDSIKQQLFSIQISAAAAQARWQQDEVGTQTALADVRASSKAALVEMNALLQQLSPAPLEQVGLVDALQEQALALEYRTGAAVQVNIGQLPEEERFPVGSQEAIFRMTQEAFSNIARHARAQQVILQLDTERSADSAVSDALVLEIKDNGQGFEITAVTNGMGLQNIRQRAAALDGNLSVKSTPGEGTNLHIAIPLEEFILQKEFVVEKPDYLLSKLGLTGFLGGLVLAVVCYYPLYGLLPGRYVADWPSGNNFIGGLCLLAAVLLTAIIGCLGAKQLQQNGRSVNMLAGGVTGTITAVIFFAAVGGAAAGVIGSQTLLQHGYATANSEAHFLYLLTNAVNGIIWWVYGGFWPAVLAGALLGALGGLLAPRHWPEPGAINKVIIHAVLVALVLSSATSLFLTEAIYTLLGPQIVTTSIEIAAEGYALLLPAWGSGFWPPFTTMLVYIFSLTGLTIFMRRPNTSLSPASRYSLLIGTYFCVLLAATIPLLLLVIAPNLTENILFIVGLLANLGLALLLAHQSTLLVESFPRKQAADHSWDLVSRLSLPIGIALSFVLAWRENWVLGVVALLLAGGITLIMQRREFQLGGTRPSAHYLAITLQAFVISVLGFILPHFAFMSSALGQMLLVIYPIPLLDPENGETVSRGLTQQIQALYQLHWASLAAWVILGTVMLGIVLLVLKISSMRKKHE
ncbi:MAG: sensor histidine kinase [Chloroflexi bacterium]|nr:sensor histidine kinase [Chloroflexota bacterium]